MSTPIPTPTVCPASTEAFAAELAAEGFDAAELREYAPGVFNDTHSHPFAVKALMLEGELTLRCGGQSTTYHAGEVFTMAAGCEHAEQFGPVPTRYLVGRKPAG